MGVSPANIFTDEDYRSFIPKMQRYILFILLFFAFANLAGGTYRGLRLRRGL
jgi:hypothetical protein